MTPNPMDGLFFQLSHFANHQEKVVCSQTVDFWLLQSVDRFWGLFERLGCLTSYKSTFKADKVSRPLNETIYKRR